MSSTQVYEWYGRFKKGLILVEEEFRKSSTSVNDETEGTNLRMLQCLRKDENERRFGSAKTGYCIMTMTHTAFRF